MLSQVEQESRVEQEIIIIIIISIIIRFKKKKKFYNLRTRLHTVINEYVSMCLKTTDNVSNNFFMLMIFSHIYVIFEHNFSCHLFLNRYE